MMAESNFLQEDVDKIRNKCNNISFQTITSVNCPDYPELANHVIDAWCYSAKRPIEKSRGEIDFWDRLVDEEAFFFPETYEVFFFDGMWKRSITQTLNYQI